jgi:hypothetical protein
VGSELDRQTYAGDQVDDLNRANCTDMALISTIKPWSGKRVEVSQTKPTRSRVANSTTPQMTRAI